MAVQLGTGSWVLIVFLGVCAALVAAARPSAASKTARQRTELFSAALDDSTSERLAGMIQKGLSIDLRDPDGNTALHLAHYRSQQDSIDRLRRFGADENLVNNLGLVPAEMAQLKHYEDLVYRGALLVSMHGDWLDKIAGRKVYDELQVCDARLYEPALVRVMLAHPLKRRRVLCLAIKLGRPGSELRLIQALDGFGDKAMADDFLNAGSDRLAAAARTWAMQRGYQIIHKSGHQFAFWGVF
jgi:hypothetical protein